MRLLRPSFFVLLIESGVVSSCTRRIRIIYEAPRQCRLRVCQTYGIDEKSKAARVDEKDNDNRTPLHYAV